jgi:hypothetical protein
MLREKKFWYFLLCILISVLPISCDIQKRRYLPGYFVQSKTFAPGKYYASNSAPGHIVLSNSPDITSSNYSSPSPLWVNNLQGKITADRDNYSFRVPEKSIQQHSNKIIKAEQNSGVLSKNEGKSVVSKQPVNSEYKNLILALLAGAGSVLLLIAVRRSTKRSGIIKSNERDKSRPNDPLKTKEEIANIAYRLDRCADRFANAKNDIIESAARKAAIAINNSGDLKRAKELEKLFHDVYLAPSQASALKHIKLHNLTSRDMSYGNGNDNGNGSLKPDVIATAGGYYKNKVGSLSWTIGEPVTETFSDGSDFLTQGFQQGIYMVATVIDETAQGANVSIYPNPFTSILNIKNDTNNPISVQTIDMQGNIINTQLFENPEGQVDFGTLSNELYILRVYDKDGNLLKVFKVEKVN